MTQSVLDKVKEIFETEFPRFSPRTGQLETVVEIIEAFESGKKHVVFEGPTGSGKSIIAYLFSCYEREKERRTCMTTITKSLQDQYISDFVIADIRSSSDERYICDYGLTRKELECKHKQKETNKECLETCPYKHAFIRFMKSSISSTNLHFFARLPKTNKENLVIDECHKLSDVVLSSVEFKLAKLNNVYVDFGFSRSEKIKKQFISAWEKVIEAFSVYNVNEVFMIPEDISEAHEALGMVLSAITFLESHEKMTDNKLLKNTLRHMHSLRDTLKNIISCANTQFVALKDLEFKPIYASAFTHDLVFSKSNRVLHMSATVGWFEAYCKEVGISSGDAVFVSSEHIIPADIRKVNIQSVAWMSYKNYDANVEKTVKFIDALFKYTKQQHNMLIHTVSYKRADDIARLSKYEVLVPRNHKEVVNILKSRKGVIVASPSIVAGIDAKDDMARYNIISKMPFPSFGDPRIKFISEHSPDLLSLMVVRDIIQASGRTSRHETDWSETFIIDGMFTKVYNDNSKMFPKWFRDSLVFK